MKEVLESIKKCQGNDPGDDLRLMIKGRFNTYGSDVIPFNDFYSIDKEQNPAVSVEIAKSIWKEGKKYKNSQFLCLKKHEVEELKQLIAALKSTLENR
eukprot:UN07316